MLSPQRINQGTIAEADEPPLIRERAQPADLRFEGVELIDTRQRTIDEFLDRWYAEKIREGQIDALAAKVYAHGEKGFDDRSIVELKRLHGHLSASRILCVTRVLGAGAERINAAMHRRAAAVANRLSDRARFLAGEPVWSCVTTMSGICLTATKD